MAQIAKTPEEYLTEARQVSFRLKFAVFFTEGLSNGKPLYVVYRRLPNGKVSALTKVSSPRAVAAYMRKQELPLTRANPAARSFRDEAAAAKLAARFHGREPSAHERKIFDFPNIPDSLTNIGKVAAIEYIAERDGEEFVFRHEFRKVSRPHMAVAPDGDFMTMLGGKWHFTEDGFEDL